MATEIEHKFLVRTELWRPRSPGRLIRQGYLSVQKERVVRIRMAGDGAVITVKGETRGLTRHEFEYAIPVADAEFILNTLCLKPVLVKTRYRETLGRHSWDVDVFHDENDGLVLAEVELENEQQSFEKPAWAGDEVSNDPRYFNSNLTTSPFRQWRNAV